MYNLFVFILITERWKGVVFTKKETWINIGLDGISMIRPQRFLMFYTMRSSFCFVERLSSEKHCTTQHLTLFILPIDPLTLGRATSSAAWYDCCKSARASSCTNFTAINFNSKTITDRGIMLNNTRDMW